MTVEHTFYRRTHKAYTDPEYGQRWIDEDVRDCFDQPVSKSTVKSVEIVAHVLGLKKATPKDLKRWRKLGVLNANDEFVDETFHDFDNEEGIDVMYELLSLLWKGKIICGNRGDDGSIRYFTPQFYKR